MNSKQIAYDCIALDQGQIVEDSKCCLKVNAVIARAGVYQYEDGKALKSKLELLKTTRTARYAKLIVGNHPSSQVIMNQNDIHGGVEKPFFDNGKIRAILSFDKYTLPDETINQIRTAVTTKTGIDNSIGFYYDADWTSGIDKNVNTDLEERYDYVMRNIVIDHVAVITDNQNGRLQGRCHFPKCGIGADCLTCPRKVGKTFSSTIQGFKRDVVEKRGDKWCVMHCHGPKAGTPIACFSTKEEAEAQHRAIEANKHDSTEYSDPTDYPKWHQVTKTVTSKTGEKSALFSDGISFLEVSGPHLSSVQVNGGKKKEMAQNQDKDKDEIGITTPEEFQKCVRERMKMGMTQGQAETYCQAFTTREDYPTPVNQPTTQEETGQTGNGNAAKTVDLPTGAEGGGPSGVEKTPLEKCVKNQMDGGKSEAEATEWCKADLGGEHESTDTIVANAAKLLEKKRQHDIESQHQHIS